MNGNNRSLACAVRGPVTLITIGALFALNNFTEYSFRQTWPVILIVFGLLSLWRRTGPTNVGPGAYPYQTPPYQAPGAGPQAGYSQPPYPQSGYPQAAPPAPAGDAGQPPAPGASV